MAYLDVSDHHVEQVRAVAADAVNAACSSSLRLFVRSIVAVVFCGVASNTDNWSRKPVDSLRIVCCVFCQLAGEHCRPVGKQKQDAAGARQCTCESDFSFQAINYWGL